MSYNLSPLKLQGRRKFNHINIYSINFTRIFIKDIYRVDPYKSIFSRETVFIEEIVIEIRTRLNLHLSTEVLKLIGVDFSIHQIRSWLKEGSTKTANILTIWGMAGIGKTSLAEYMYRSHCHEFERSSFLEGIERKCAQNSSALLDFQKQILEDILKKRMVQVRNVNVSTAKIEKALFNKRTLVVLDGIDNFEQLDVLIGTKGCFHPGSKIIITTKDGSITEKCALFHTRFPPEHTKHRLYGIGDAASLQLLCWHAFRCYDPKEGYAEEARRVAEYCKGHPLALKVLGSSLINEDVAAWSDTLEMLQKKELHNDIQKVLRVGYDSLPSESSKELFKHIACFFVGEDREVTETILNECGIRTSYGIKKLIERCLLTSTPWGNELMMHQLIQDMGRDIVHQESPKKPWKRSRLWNHEESLDLLRAEKGTTNIQGLLLDMKVLEKEMLPAGSNTGTEPPKFEDGFLKNTSVVPSVHNIVYKLFSRIWWFLTWIFMMFSSAQSKKPELRTNALGKMEKLNLLQLNHVKLNGSYMNFPKGLRWLCMHGSLLTYIPSDLPMENLAALDMSYSDLKCLWKKPKHLGSLKILNLSYCKIVSVGGFSEMPALQRLILKGCASLVHLSESIDRCAGLVLLDLSHCKKLKRLPSNIGKLKKVQVLSIDGCICAHEFPIDMKDMESLEKLNADNTITKSLSVLSSVTEVIPKSPKSFLVSLPPSLLILSLKNNNLSNDSFPMQFSSLTMLKELYLDENPIDSMPDCVKSLSKIKFLSFENCHMLKSILCPPPTIKYLIAASCSSLVKITFDQEIPTPPDITYCESLSLTEIQGVIKIQPLAEIDDMILSSLGWTDLRYLNDQELHIKDPIIRFHPKKLPIQMLYEFGIFSTCFQGKEVPSWFAQRNEGLSISVILPSSPINKRIQGLNIGLVHTVNGEGRRMRSSLITKVSNMTQNRTWMYYGYLNAVPEAEKDIVWVSHWMFGNNEFVDGDEVSVTIGKQDGKFWVKECAISIVYNDGDKEEDLLSYYKSWKHIIGGDLSPFQLTSGDYFLIHDRLYEPRYGFERLLKSTRVRKLLGYTAEYRGMSLIYIYIYSIRFK
ncbi:hypothetical protein OSB04_012420 [Centaurea solstitialis]|uniref:ADP-ribosyl cyclase/cyclic ADP-ribose hydrolase n=1 Tax=Centaurea solstitialis TaxID=347529 RepID=A0AA38TPD2_9ASTR|nr:hypothetical protein OSB04_012420 [Centaurea solstitialis]